MDFDFPALEPRGVREDGWVVVEQADAESPSSNPHLENPSRLRMLVDVPASQTSGHDKAMAARTELCRQSSLQEVEDIARKQDGSIESQQARKIIEPIDRLLRCPRECREGERDVFWLFHAALLEREPATVLLILIELFLPEYRLSVHVQTEEQRKDLLEVLDRNNEYRVKQPTVAMGREGLVTLCKNDQLRNPSVLEDVNLGDASSPYFHFDRDVLRVVTDWAEKITFSDTQALRALAALSRSEWPEKVAQLIAKAISRTLEDANRFSNETMIHHSTEITVWMARSPMGPRAVLAEALQKRAADFEEVLSCFSMATQSHNPTSLVLTPVQSRFVGGFREDLVSAASEEVRRRLRAARKFYDALAEKAPEEDVPLSVAFGDCEFPCAPCWDLQAVNVSNEKVKKISSSKTRPVSFALDVRQGANQPESKKFFRKEEDDMLKQETVARIVEQFATRVSNDAEFQKLSEKLGIDPSTFHAGYHRIQTIYPGIGVIEAVPKALTLRQVVNEHKNVQAFLWTLARRVEGDGLETKPKRLSRNFGVSSALWFVISFLLGLGDRHNDNVMVTEDGIYAHIDFGWILGLQTKSDRFLFWDIAVRLDFEELSQVLGEEMDLVFYNTLKVAYNVLRSDPHLLVEQLCLCAELDLVFGTDKVRQRIQSFVQERCQPDISDPEAAEAIKQLAIRCANNRAQDFRDEFRSEFQQLQATVSDGASVIASGLRLRAMDTFILGVSAAGALRDNLIGVHWERAPHCSVCQQEVVPAARWLDDPARSRHHCRRCRRTVCGRRDCSSYPQGEREARCCKICREAAEAPATSSVPTDRAGRPNAWDSDRGEPLFWPIHRPPPNANESQAGPSDDHAASRSDEAVVPEQHFA